MKPYNLLLLSDRFPSTLDGIHYSFQMIAWGLWREFWAMPHVAVRYQSVYDPVDGKPTDFILAHYYFGSALNKAVLMRRPSVRHEVLLFMEIPNGPPLFDRCFTYLPFPQFGYCEQIECPCLLDAIAAHNAPKRPRTVLLDHYWRDHAAKGKDFSAKLHEWLAGTPYEVSQLRRLDNDADFAFPPWVRQIPELPYPDYLDATADQETFVLTHIGSYEHSIIDMVARGTRVIIPSIDGVPQAPRGLVERLNLPTFADRDELLALLSSPVVDPLPPGALTDMPQVAARIDAYIQGKL